jgi:hypothetical protein
VISFGRRSSCQPITQDPVRPKSATACSIWSVGQSEPTGRSSSRPATDATGRLSSPSAARPTALSGRSGKQPATSPPRRQRPSRSDRKSGTAPAHPGSASASQPRPEGRGTGKQDRHGEGVDRLGPRALQPVASERKPSSCPQPEGGIRQQRTLAATVTFDRPCILKASSGTQEAAGHQPSPTVRRRPRRHIRPRWLRVDPGADTG